MDTYYASRYLNVYPSKNGSSILFHGVTGSIDEVDQELGRYLKSSQTKETPLERRYDDSVMEFLKGRGHITTLDPQSEWKSFKEYVEQLHTRIRERQMQSGFLMLVPSYFCNLACAYCYQNPMRAAEGKGAAAVMTPALAGLIFDGVLPKLFPSIKRKSQISVNLYGGEPFLERNRPALEKILERTQEHQMSVSAISNASVLDYRMEYFGIKIGLVNSLQISFDGDKIFHDQSRVTHGGRATFDRIIANIHRLLDRGLHINLRVNTNKQNVFSLSTLWERLLKEEIAGHPHVTTYAAAIHNHFDQANPEPLFSPAVLTRQMEAQTIPIRTPLDKKMSRLSSLFDAEEGIPLNRTHFCMQNMPNAFLIDHRRDIYSCYEEAGNRQMAAGSFDEAGNVTLNKRYDLYQSRHVASYEPCSQCSVALTCGGGCPVAARGANLQGSIFTSHCDSHKELVAMAVQRLFQKRMEGTSKPAWEEDNLFVEQPYL